MWTAQYLKMTKDTQLVMSGGLGTMGYGLGAAIGAKMARKDKLVFNIAGDGCFRMNMNEIATAARQKLPLIEVIVNNHVLGMVRQWQTSFYGKRYSQTDPHRKTDFVKLADGFGLKGYRCTNLPEFQAAFADAMKQKGPTWIECIIDKDEKVLPMIPGGGDINDIMNAHNLAMTALNARMQHERNYDDEKLAQRGLRRLDIDPERVQWSFVLDFCCQALRKMRIGPAGGLAQTAAHVLPQPAQALDQTQRRGGLSLAQRRGRDGRHLNILAVRPILQPPHDTQKIQLRRLAVGQQLLRLQPQPFPERLHVRQRLLRRRADLPILIHRGIEHPSARLVHTAAVYKLHLHHTTSSGI